MEEWGLDWPLETLKATVVSITATKYSYLDFVTFANAEEDRVRVL